MRRFLIVPLCLTLACNILPITVSPPTNVTAIVGGITDQRPFFGKIGWPIASADSELVLATCGCGEWKAYVKQSADADAIEFDLQFFTPGDYVPTGSVTVYGMENGNGLSGNIDQDSGAASGNLALGDFKTFFSAQRGDKHQDQVEACALCHTGTAPISPLAADHPAYTLSPANCLDCHQVVITN